MKGRLSQVLADSHVAAVSIGVLLMWTIDAVCRGLWDPLYKFSAFLLSAIAIWDIPYIPSRPSFGDRLMLLASAHFLYSAFACILGSLLVSYAVYATGPIRSLTACRNELIRRKDA
jgi:hypothetical protein